MPSPWANILVSTTVVASPAAAAETTVAQLRVGSVADAAAFLDLSAWVAYTVGASGTSVRLRIRRDSITGTTVADSGLMTRAAASLQADHVEGTDAPGDVASVLYVVTMTVAAGAAVSTVSAVKVRAIVSG